MRFFLTVLLTMFLSIQMQGQRSTYWNTSTNDKAHQSYQRSLNSYAEEDIPFSPFRLSQSSFYTGAGTNYEFNFDGSDTSSTAFDSRFSISGDIILNLLPPINVGKTAINLPFRGNIQGFLFGQDPDATYELGLYPFLQIPETKSSVDWIVHAGFEGKINPTQEGFEASRRDLRIFAGIEAAIFVKDRGNPDGKPIVIGITPVWEKVSLFPKASFGAEATLLFELSDGFAFVGRGYLARSGKEYRDSGLQVGIALSGAKKG